MALGNCRSDGDARDLGLYALYCIGWRASSLCWAAVATRSIAEVRHAANTIANDRLPAGLSPEVADTYREAQSGNPQAMAKLANAYETGEGAPQHFQQAINWFAKAAEAGDSSAMYRLGRIYAAGSGVPKDYREAARWYEKAAAAGNADAMYSLGRAYETGSGVSEDVQQAVRWYDAAELRGNKEAKAAAERLGESVEDH